MSILSVNKALCRYEKKLERRVTEMKKNREESEVEFLKAKLEDYRSRCQDLEASSESNDRARYVLSNIFPKWWCECCIKMVSVKDNDGYLACTECGSVIASYLVEEETDDE